MRRCPVCDGEMRTALWRMDFLIPDGWTRPKYIDWYKCECGMLYGDHPTITQADYSKYYNERYGYGVTDSDQQGRIHDRAVYINAHIPKDAVIVDFGGGEGDLTRELRNFGYEWVINVGAGDELPEACDVVIAEHVLEHVYSMNIAMNDITESLKDGGMLIVDVPDAGAIAFERPPKMPILDFTQVHINHFRMLDMLKLAERWGFELVSTTGYTERNMPCRMFVFVKDINVVSRYSKWFVVRNTEAMLSKLRDIGDKPVIVWGLGDIALHLLARQPLNVKYFVCNDPAYKSQTIGRVPILDKPISDHPIVVMAQSQKELLLENIKKVCENEVIVI